MALLATEALAAQSRGAGDPVRVTLSPVQVITNAGTVELYDPAGVHALHAGGILLADRRPVTVRVVDDKTGASRQVARAGAGPGEFRAAPSFVGYAGDSIVAYDAMLKRWTLLSPLGDVVRPVETTDPMILDKQAAARVFAGAVVFSASLDAKRAPSASAVRALVASLPARSGVAIVRQSDTGDLWAAPTFIARTWTVFDNAGALRATIAFDQPVRVTSIRGDRVIGVSLDADEIPSIVTATLPPIGRMTTRPAPRPSPALQRAATDVPAQLGRLLQSLIPRQEQAYVDGSAYTTSIAKLGIVVPTATDVRIVQATDRGWFATAVDKQSGATCAIGVGFALIGWDEGKAYCSER